MQYKKAFELEDDAPVPEQLRWAIARSISHARHCSIKEVMAGRRTKQINSFKLTLAQRAAKPKESADDIAQAVCNVMHNRWEERALDAGADDVGPIEFRIEFQSPDNPKTQRPMVPWKWDPRDDADPSLVDEAQAFDQLMRQDLMDLYSTRIETDRVYIADIQERFLKLAELNAEPIKQTGEQLAFANSLSLQGMTALVQATQMTYSYEANKAMEEQKTERWKMIADKLGPGVRLAMGQLAGFIGKKVTGKNVTIPRGGVADVSDEEGPTNGAAHSPDFGGTTEYETPPEPGVQPDPSDDDEEEEEEITDPLASFAQAFGENMTNSQRRELRKLMKVKHYAIFEDMFCAEADAEAIAHYERLAEEVPAAALVQLLLLLDEDQQKDFQTFRKLMDKTIAKRDAQPSEDGGGEDEN